MWKLAALGLFAWLGSTTAGATEKSAVIPAKSAMKVSVATTAVAKAAACPSTLATLLQRLTALQAKQVALQQELAQIVTQLRGTPGAATGEFTGEGTGLR